MISLRLNITQNYRSLKFYKKLEHDEIKLMTKSSHRERERERGSDRDERESDTERERREKRVYKKRRVSFLTAAEIKYTTFFMSNFIFIQNTKNVIFPILR